MTKDDIIRMAREAEMPEWLQEDWFADPFDSFALKFANLVAAAEREACAKILDEMAGKDRLSNYFQVAAIAIRARGEQ